MTTKNRSTAVYLQADYHTFVLVGARDLEGDFLTTPRGKRIQRKVSKDGRLATYVYTRFTDILEDGTAPGTLALRNIVRDTTAGEISEVLLAVLGLQFELLSRDGKACLFSQEDRQILIRQGGEFYYTVEKDGIVIEKVYLGFKTIRGWANVLNELASTNCLQGVQTTGDAYGPNEVPEVLEPVVWSVFTESAEQALLALSWIKGVVKAYEHNYHVAQLFEGKDHQNRGYNPLMTRVWWCGNYLTCFAELNHPGFGNKSASEFDGVVNFIVLTPPAKGSRVGFFTLVSREKVMKLFVPVKPKELEPVPA